MNRTLLIARREIMAYVKTVGFWLSLLSLPFFATLGAAVPSLMKKAEPVNAFVIVDEAGDDGSLAAAVRAALERDYQAGAMRSLALAAVPEAGTAGRDKVDAAIEAGGHEAGKAALAEVAPRAAATFKPPRRELLELELPQDLAAARTPAERDAVARRWVAEDERIRGETLNSVVILTREDGKPSARVWNRRASNMELENRLSDALAAAHRDETFSATGMDSSVIRAVTSFRPELSILSPRAASGGEVSLRDRLPAVIGMVCGFMMWSLILTGATMLMNGVMEEKSNKILEVLLSSVTSTELLAGKVLGVAILTLTVMGGWAVIGAVGLSAAFPEVARDIGAVLLEDGLWFFLLLYLVGGYLMYAVLFAAIGAFCETPRDAQTLMGPVMMALVVPLLFMQMAMRTPDAAILKVMSLIPPFTPFIMSARVPGGVRLFEVVISLLAMFAFAALMMWLSGRAFRAGAMSDAKLSWKSFVAAMRAN